MNGKKAARRLESVTEVEAYMGEESGIDGRIMGEETGFPFVYSHVYKTDKGVPYLRAPGVHLIGKPQVDLSSVDSFLAGFDSKLNFRDYLQDDPIENDDGAKLVKFAGQACYASFGPKRTKNADKAKYLGHIKESKHGSCVEHAVYSLFVYGVSRSLSHELIRHRFISPSQLSQRYVSGSVLRFIERPESQTDPELHDRFERWIEASAEEYEGRAQHLLHRQTAGDTSLTADRKTDLRKKVQQAARACLPNETETFMVLTGNVRAWRHTVEMRAAAEADLEIRELLVRIFKCLKVVSPTLFDDYSYKDLSDGTVALDTPYRKI